MNQLLKLARKFQLKLAQQHLEGLTEEEKAQYHAAHSKSVNEQDKAEINEKIKQMISNPATNPKANYAREMAQAMQNWIAQHPTFTEEELDTHQAEWAESHKDPTPKPKSNFMNELNEFLEGPTQEQEFTKQDKDIQQFMDKEKADKAVQQKSIQGKTPFNTQDAAAIINSELNEIKAYVQKALKRKLVGDQKIMFIFYPNSNIGVVGQDIAMVNIIRRGFMTSLQLASRSFCAMHKKYFTDQVKYEISL